jgi:hypothetical protein
VSTHRVTCEWTDHPGQRHKAIRETFDGGLNVFRSRCEVRHPLRFQSSASGLTDEVARCAGLPRAPPVSRTALEVLIVGELTFNGERVLALTERGHRLHGLWTRQGLGDSTVGPVPFGHVDDVPQETSVHSSSADVPCKVVASDKTLRVVVTG